MLLGYLLALVNYIKKTKKKLAKSVINILNSVSITKQKRENKQINSLLCIIFFLDHFDMHNKDSLCSCVLMF